jgi:predicted ATPase
VDTFDDATPKRFGGTDPEQAPPGASIRSHLHRLLDSRTLANAPGLRRLLEHVVIQTIEGQPDRLKEYTLGVDVFQRGTSFDPHTDTIVRVSARRLRAKLEQYYRTEGLTDTVVISLPKGRYAPEFRSRPGSSARAGTLARDGLVRLQSMDGGFQQISRVFRVPAPRNALIGREHELDMVCGLLRRPDVRLVTLTGVGGSGKTRLALEAASRVREQFRGGVIFVSVAGLGDANAVTPTLAQVLGLRHTEGRPLDEALRDHVESAVCEPTLLVIDNYEHLLASAPLLGVLLDAARSLKILVTSRIVVRLYGEHDYSVPPLTLPDRTHPLTASRLRPNPAVALFLARASAADCGFALTDENAAAVAEICCRLDGLPLAIELAAARVRTLPPEEMLARLDRRLNLPGSSARDAPERQHTLRHTLDWSYGLLSPGEQQLFRRLSVFAGGCTFEAAEAVCNARLDLQIDVRQGLSSLVDHSLLQRVGEGGSVRFQMIETVREYDLELLVGSGEREEVSRAHAAYCLVVAEEGLVATTPGERNEWLGDCQAEHENFRAALDYLIAGNHAGWAQRLGIALHAFWDRHDHVAEGRARLESIIALGDGDARRCATWAKAACYAAGLATVQGDYGAALGLHQRALDVYREIGDRRGVITELCGIGFAERELGDHASARRSFEQCVEECRAIADRSSFAEALSNLAGALTALGDYAGAGERLQEAAAVFRELGDWSGFAWSCNHLGDVARQRGDPAESSRRYQEGLGCFRQAQDPWGVARSCADLGFLACHRGDPAAARRWFDEALRTFRALGHLRGIIHTIEGFAVLTAMTGDPERALVLGGAMAVCRKHVEAGARRHEQVLLARALDLARNEAADSAPQLWSAGLLLGLDDAIGIALEEIPLPFPEATGN